MPVRDRLESPWAGRILLALAMLVSGAAVMYVGRGTTFSGDEMVWVASSPGINLETLLTPHGGHLQLVPRAVYRLMLGVTGLEYWPYRLLTVLTSWLTVGLLYAWLARRVSGMVALAPCLVLLVFGSDALHVIQGNGFTILLSIACGISALLMLEREDRAGDLGAAALLLVGVMTYGVALAFVFGVLVLVLCEPGRRRWWVPAVPVLAYAAWWLWAGLTDVGGEGGGATLSNLLLLPAWTFQAIGSSADAISGFSFDFGSGNRESFGFAAPLAVLAIIAVGMALVRQRARRGLVVACAIGFALWTLQVLVAEPGEAGRLPNDVRYLLPGAVVLAMILAEVLERVSWTPVLLVTVGLLAVSGIGTNLKLLSSEGASFRAQAVSFEDNVGVVALATGNRPPDRSRQEMVKSQGGLIVAMTDLPWGEYGTEPKALATRPPADRSRFDAILVSTSGIKLVPVQGNPHKCDRIVAGESGEVSGRTRSGGVFESPIGTQLRLGRFAAAAQPVGTLAPHQPAALLLAPDGYDVGWSFKARTPWLKVCHRWSSQ